MADFFFGAFKPFSTYKSYQGH